MQLKGSDLIYSDQNLFVGRDVQKREIAKGRVGLDLDWIGNRIKSRAIDCNGG